MKKRSKKYTPRPVNLPMMRETHTDLTLGMRLSIEALIDAPSVETYNAVSLRLVTLGRVVGAQDFMESAKAAMLSIFARYERVNKTGGSEPEAAQLRDASRLMDAVIALVPVNKFAAAEAKTLWWCAANNVQA